MTNSRRGITAGVWQQALAGVAALALTGGAASAYASLLGPAGSEQLSSKAAPAPTVPVAFNLDRSTQNRSIQYLDQSLIPGGGPGSSLQHIANPVYDALRNGLDIYRSRWGRLPQDVRISRTSVKLGDRGAAVDALYRRLGVRQLSDRFDRSLETRLRDFQKVHGLTAHGRADSLTISALNRGSSHYEARILRNILRARGLKGNSDHKFVLVDTAAARLLAFKQGRQALRMNVALGSADHPTPHLADKIESVVVNPEWNLPPHLVREMVAPAVLKDGLGFLADQEYDVLSDWSDDAVPADPGSVDWQAVKDGQAYARVRQQPGEGNPMGRIKFMFPNHLGIYLHDTPDHQIFEKDVRYVSNGCVRIEHADKLAQFLIPEKLSSILQTESTEFRIDEAVPIYIMNFSFWVEDTNIIFRNPSQTVG